MSQTESAGKVDPCLVGNDEIGIRSASPIAACVLVVLTLFSLSSCWVGCSGDHAGNSDDAGYGETACDRIDEAVGNCELSGSAFCSVDGWCWQYPLPHGNQIDAAWGAADDDIWAVGPAGSITRWDGFEWSEVPSGVTEDLEGIWGFGPDDIWAVGVNGVVLHWDGSEWSAHVVDERDDLRAVWGVDGGDFWVIGTRDCPGYRCQVLWHFEDGIWKESLFEEEETLVAMDVHGSARDDIWMVGYTGQYEFSYFYITHWDGIEWTEFKEVSNGVAINRLGVLSRVYCEARDACWATGVEEVFSDQNPPSSSFIKIVLEFDGNEWTKAEDAGDFQIGDPWLDRVNELLCSSDRQEEEINEMFGVDEADVWAVGSRILHWNGAEWVIQAECPELNTYRSIWGSAADDVWTIAERSDADFSRYVHFDGNQWAVHGTGSGCTLLDLWGSSSDDIWAVGRMGCIRHWDGSGWTRNSAVEGSQVVLHSASISRLTTKAWSWLPV